MCFNIVNLSPSGHEKSQLPFKVEITPKVLVLLCFIGVCLFSGDFHMIGTMYHNYHCSVLITL